MDRQTMYLERAQRALEHYNEFIALARDALRWAKADRQAGCRDLWVESMQNAAKRRERAAFWLGRYRKACAKLPEALWPHTYYCFSYVTPEGYSEHDRVAEDQVNTTLQTLKEQGCREIAYWQEVA